MTDINAVFLVGRTTRDAELKYAASGLGILNFSIASNRSMKRGEAWVDEVSYFDCVLFGKRAESLSQYMIKGKQLAIGGSLKQDRWTDKEGGNRSKVKVIVDNVQFVGNRQTEAAAVPVTSAPVEDSFDDQIPF